MKEKNPNRNLFSYETNGKGDNQPLDSDTPFVKARLSEQTQTRLNAASQGLHKEFMKAMRKDILSYIGFFLLLFVGFYVIRLLFAMAESELTRSDFLFSHRASMIVFGVLLIAGIALVIIGKLRYKKYMAEDGEFSERIDALQMDDVYEQVNAELDIPESTSSIEILPYRWKQKMGNIFPADPKSHYDNIPMEVWDDGLALCFTDCKTVVAIPKENIVGIRTVDQKITLTCWMKDEDMDSDMYKDFNIKDGSDGLSICVRGYGDIEVNAPDGVRHILVPCYDLPALYRVIPLQKLDTGNEK